MLSEPSSFHLAASRYFRGQNAKLAEEICTTLKIRCTSRWLLSDEESINSDMDKAHRDRADVIAADMMVYIPEPDCTEGMVEFGIALAMDIPVAILRQDMRTTLVTNYDQYARYEVIAPAVEWVYRLAVMMGKEA